MSEIRNNRKKILRGSLGSTAATLLSRILGLVRTMLETRVLGGGALAATWHLALMIPNLFRKILGEGALGQALIPIMTHTEQELGEEEAKRQLSLIFIVLSGILVVISTLTSVIDLIITPFIATPHIKDACRLLPLLMPYSVFICLVGVMTAVVNIRRVFFKAALNALILNIVIIAVLFAGQKFVLKSPFGFLQILSVSVLAAGILQTIHLVWLMHQNNIMPQFKPTLEPGRKVVRNLFTLALPGMIGGIATHVSFMVDRGLAACFVGDYAVPALSNTERLVYLPIGLVAIALSSVLMTDMSRAAAEKKFEELKDDLTMGLRYVWFLCAPLAIFMIFYREALIKLLFYGGNFTYDNVLATADTMLFYAMGIPAFCATKVLLPAFYARKKMTLPLIFSLICMTLNIPLSILLMLFLQQGGIALATVLTAVLNNLLLLYFLKRDNFAPDTGVVLTAIFRSLIFAAAAAAPALYYRQICVWCRPVIIPAVPELMPLMFCGIFFGIVYLLLSYISGAPEVREICSSLIAKKSRKKEK